MHTTSYFHKPIAQKELVQFLYTIDNDYHPKISKHMPINDYAQKLLNFASIDFTRDEEGTLSSIVAYYLNQETKIAYVSIVGTNKENRRKGLSRNLCSLCIENSKKYRMRIIRIPVTKTNNSALSLYLSLGFRKSQELTHENPEKIYLDLVL